MRLQKSGYLKFQKKLRVSRCLSAARETSDFSTWRQSRSGMVSRQRWTRTSFKATYRASSIVCITSISTKSAPTHIIGLKSHYSLVCGKRAKADDDGNGDF